MALLKGTDVSQDPHDGNPYASGAPHGERSNNPGPAQSSNPSNPAGGSGINARQLVTGPLNILLIASAGAYLILNILHMVARSTETYRTNLLGAFDQVAESGSGWDVTLDTSSPFTMSTLLGWMIVLGLYAVVLTFLVLGAKWARVLGIVLACLGSANALFGFLYVIFYGFFGLVVGLAIIVYVAINVAWIVTAVRTK